MRISIAYFTSIATRIDYYLYSFIPKQQIRFFPAAIFERINIAIPTKRIITTDKNHEGFAKLVIFITRIQKY
ncbi:MAG: hypothetical protein IJI41_02715 [Anaerolineaceae bacterium]|nr:hypothetical protein [Anaerolineaceae bacterium]